MANTEENQQEKLLRLAAQGDKQAYGMLYTRYLDEIYRFVFFKVNSQQTAEDITEETFLKTWESLPRIYKKDGKIDNFRAWLYRTANNLVIDFYRKKKPVSNLEYTRPSNLPVPEEVALDHEISKELTDAVNALEPEFQQIVILRLVNELPHKEVASIMNITEGNSRVLLFRALKKLKELMKKKEGNHA
jgi:RNA polymerase sigma-70 factor (ECF subfamily)